MADLTAWVNDQISEHLTEARHASDVRTIAECEARQRVINLCTKVLANSEQAPSASVALAEQIIREIAAPTPDTPAENRTPRSDRAPRSNGTPRPHTTHPGCGTRGATHASPAGHPPHRTGRTPATPHCTGLMPRGECLGCRRLTHGTRCPACTTTRSRARDARRGTTTQRGLGWTHQQARREVLADAPPCHWCGEPADTGDHAVPRSQRWHQRPIELPTSLLDLQQPPRQPASTTPTQTMIRREALTCRNAAAEAGGPGGDTPPSRRSRGGPDPSPSVRPPGRATPHGDSGRLHHLPTQNDRQHQGATRSSQRYHSRSAKSPVTSDIDR